MNESLEDQISRLSAMLEEQRQELNALRARVRAGGEVRPHSRREVLRLAGAAVAGAAGGIAIQAIPAAAANGAPLTLRQVNDASATTQLHSSPASSPNPLFQVDGSTSTGDAIS